MMKLIIDRRLGIFSNRIFSWIFAVIYIGRFLRKPMPCGKDIKR